MDCRSCNFAVVLPDEKDLESFLEKYGEKNKSVKFIYGQLEKSNNGFKHVQLVVGLVYQKTLTAAIKFFEISTVRIVDDLPKALSYASDEKKRIDGTNVIEIGKLPKIKLNTHELICKSKTREEAEGHLKNNAYLWIEKKAVMMAHIDQMFPEKYVHDYSFGPNGEPGDFRVGPLDMDEHPIVILVGPTCMGKTAYAAAHGNNPLLAASMVGLSALGPSHDLLICDDMKTSQLSSATLLELCDFQKKRRINVKHSYGTLAKGLKTFFTVNSMDEFWPKDIHPSVKEAIERRIEIVYVNEPLMKDPNSVAYLKRKAEEDLVGGMYGKKTRTL